MKIAIHGRSFAKDIQPQVQVLFDILHQKDAEMAISESFYDFLKTINIQTYTVKCYPHPGGAPDADFIFSIGGDGTLLESVMQARERKIPILGFNTGRLGFLATVSPAAIADSLQRLFDQQFQIEKRVLVSVASNEDLFEGYNYALNDFTITKTDTSSMITVHTYLDDEFMNSYWADGLIVSTPTGSTGYSLSCGGPVILPTNRVFVVTPISPHNLNVRPMVIPDTSVLRFSVESRSNNFLISLDSRFRIVDGSIQLKVQKEQFKAKLVRLESDTFLKTLRSKLHWGLDARN